MARTVVGSAVVVREKYFWPDAQLNFWTIVMLATAGTIVGVNAQFMVIQNQMRLGIPWIFPYSVAVGSIAITFIIIMMILIAQRRLLPGVMFLFSFILLVLFITGIVGTALQLFAGPNVNNLCNMYVGSQRLVGPNGSTLAWLQQNSICQQWQAAFAFWIIGTVFLVWMMFMASQVNNNQYDYR
ncbi:hypothetical protein P280DRAFT_307320 [Massarina eburnea CBS 473.64]|uniref:MARVEL domain-containing protein n=1 Tax=Massarina eburnea CBS 473.64 TaxID=1395130 RepID=A0A6A6S3M1_9PLEO|nr:hypothetical protein P280DRAFT_307320 [Massarina eburnea CBS 473.64]